MTRFSFIAFATLSTVVISTTSARADEAPVTDTATTEIALTTSSSSSVAMSDMEDTRDNVSRDGLKIAAAKFKKVPPVSTEGTRFKGNVSWYGPGFHGKLTASGKKFDMNKLTCAHKSLPFYTKVLVENPKNGRSVTIDVNDRGPFVADRIIDLSRESARRLGTLTGGVAYVECLIVDEGGKGAN